MDELFSAKLNLIQLCSFYSTLTRSLFSERNLALWLDHLCSITGSQWNHEYGGAKKMLLIKLVQNVAIDQKYAVLRTWGRSWLETICLNRFYCLLPIHSWWCKRPLCWFSLSVGEEAWPRWREELDDCHLRCQVNLRLVKFVLWHESQSAIAEINTRLYTNQRETTKV